MALTPIDAICTNCGTKFRDVPRRTFLGFQKFQCPKCLEKVTYPLTDGYRITYWILLTLAFIAAVSQGNIPIPGGFGIAIIVALISDMKIRKRIAFKETTPLSPTLPNKIVSERRTTINGHAPVPVHGEANIAVVSGQSATVIDEDRIYSKIADEFEVGVTEKGLWTRLFAECGGDERQTKVLYIKQRADRLISAERLRLEQAARERAAETEERLRLEQAALKRAAETERAEKRRPPPSDAQQMKEYCISFDGERYTYGEYKYDKLADAINYAKLQKKRSTHHST